MRRTLLSCTKNIRMDAYYTLCDFCCFDYKTLHDIRQTFWLFIHISEIVCDVDDDDGFCAFISARNAGSLF